MAPTTTTSSSSAPGSAAGHRSTHREGLPRRRHRGRGPFRRRRLPGDVLRGDQVPLPPEIGCYGIQRIDALRDCLIVSGAGVGGGSLVYASTLFEPLPAFCTRTRSGATSPTGATKLAPYYDQAKRMLGVVENPLRTPLG